MKWMQVVALFCVALLTACQPDEDFVLDDGIVDINRPNDGNPNDNPGDNNPGVNQAQLEELGRLLFWDPILSGELDVSCATCHHPDFGYADGRRLPIGVGGVGLGPDRRDAVNDDIGLVGRNSPTVLNTAFNGMREDGSLDAGFAPMFWDNRANGLEEQALLPLHSFEEMRGHAFDESVTLDSIVARLRANNQYQNLFTTAFGQQNTINSENIAVAISAFERTITATNSPFDQYQAGNQNAMTAQQIRGMDRFRQIGCDDCHGGPMFSDFELHVLGVPDSPLLPGTDAGAGGTYAFRTPTLRNLAETGPFFHNGEAADLQQVMIFYRNVRGNGGGPGGPGNGGGLRLNPNVNPNQLDQEIRNLGNFDNNDIQDIVAFIQALNDPNFDRRIPNSVPSGLNPGGNID